VALLTPIYMQPATGDPAIEYSALQDRAALLAAIFSREGVLDVDAGQLRVTQRAAGANFSVDIAAGRAAVDGDDISDQGTYLCTSTAVENRVTPQPPASGTHTHRVIARVRDKLHNGAETTYDWALEVLPDTGTGLPALPASAIHLATVTIAAGATAVTDANIVNAPDRAAVGTLNRTGAITPDPAGYDAPNASRPPEWFINPDGWVQIGGWIRRSAPDAAVTANVLYPLTSPVPSDLRPVVAANRDFAGTSREGPVMYTLDSADWVIKFRYFSNVTLVQNVSWFSLDGCGYKL
jgi:hypothetical protein